MAMIYDPQELSGTTSTGTTVAEVLGTIRGLLKYDWFMVDANLKGQSLGTLDVYLQRKVKDNVWADWLHFPQLAAAAARVYYSVQSNPAGDITVVGRGTDASAGTPALAANTTLGGHPGEALRLVAKSGTATMTGTAVSVTVTGWRRD